MQYTTINSNKKKNEQKADVIKKKINYFDKIGHFLSEDKEVDFGGIFSK